MSDASSSKQRDREWRNLRNAIGSHMLEENSMADNLAIALCTYFEGHMDRPKPDPQTDNGWGQWAEAHADRVMDELADLVLKRLQVPPSHDLLTAWDLLAEAERIVTDFANRNAKWADSDGAIQDPWGAYGWLERYRAAVTKTVSQQLEEAGFKRRPLESLDSDSDETEERHKPECSAVAGSVYCDCGEDERLQKLSESEDVSR